MKILLVNAQASNLHRHPSFKTHDVLTAIDENEAYQILRENRDIVLVISDEALNIPLESRATQCRWLQFVSVIARTDRSFNGQDMTYQHQERNEQTCSTNQ